MTGPGLEPHLAGSPSQHSLSTFTYTVGTVDLASLPREKGLKSGSRLSSCGTRKQKSDFLLTSNRNLRKKTGKIDRVCLVANVYVRP